MTFIADEGLFSVVCASLKHQYHQKQAYKEQEAYYYQPGKRQLRNSCQVFYKIHEMSNVRPSGFYDESYRGAQSYNGDAQIDDKKRYDDPERIVYGRQY